MLRNHPSDRRCDPISNDPMTVGEMARRAGCTVRSVRFYEQRGLLGVDGRTGGRHRRYARADFDRLLLIVELRRAGLSVESIRSIIDIKHRHSSGAMAAAELRDHLESHIGVIAARVSDLTRVQGELERVHAAIQCCMSCPCKIDFPAPCGECKTLATATELPLLRAIWSHLP